MEYIVSLGTEHFTFDSGEEAMEYVETSLTHFTPTEYCKELSPYISVRNEKDKEKSE